MGLLLQGQFRSQIIYPNGKMVVLPSFSNGIVTEAINDLLGIMFRAEAQLSTWFIGLIDETDFEALDADDSMSSHDGWIENDDYNEVTRVAWSPGAAAGGVLTNSLAAEFTMSAESSLQGLFIASNSTKNGTTGTLWSTGSFPAAQTVPTGAVFKAFYELTARQG